MASHRILIVEDEKITALDLKMTLEELGHAVVGSTGRAELSIDMVGSLQPDLVLMDIHLEGPMLGTEAALLIRERYATPVVFLTAYTDDKTLDEACRSLAYGYMVKPFEKREVEAAIRIAMTRANLHRDLQLSEERLRLALESARMRIWQWQPQHALEAEPAESGGSGQFYTEFEQLLAQIHPDDRSQLQQELGRNSRYRCLVRYRNDLGDYRWTQLMASVVAGRDLPRSVLGVLHDVHEDQLARERLQQAEVVFNSTSEALVVTDPEFRIVRVNPAFTTITGYRADAVIGKSADMLTRARRQEDLSEPLPLSEHSRSGEVSCLRSDGDLFPAWQHVSAITDDSGMLTGYIVTLADISALRRAEKRLEQLAFVDSLTGLANRVQLERSLIYRLAQCDDHHPLAVVYLDLDGFKRVNDTLGHGAGDQLLVEISQRLRTTLRDRDLIARVGGDEFVMVLDVHAESDLHIIARKLLAAISRPVALEREEVQVSGSIGLVITNESSGCAESLIKAADAAMFEAKKQGKNSYCFYDIDLDRELQQRLQIEQSLPAALRNNQFVLGYQPLLDAASGRVRGVEALIRWQHPQLGLLLPERFIPFAEQSQFINDIGEWVLQEICRTLRDWEAIGLKGLTMSVNVSPRQLSDLGFPQRLEAIIREYQVPPDQLELEITENALQASEPLVDQLGRIRGLGVHLAIDDFGSGYSSLSRLKELPFDRVKIDRAFIRDLPDNSDDVEICKAILALCQVLGMQVTAEGVETPSQRDLLISLGCDTLQGFLFSRAMVGSKVREWVENLGDSESRQHTGSG